ncbi:MAG: sigma-70 family RNA polymerase sigma factor [Dehalococcoidia bacterium]|uniref:sigma-70 family RNA polymerase sigma factor n=1 Tax=Candidatus Amarobacter glycogenicus TaxID=3140699 RepID=UPI002A0FF474|nr:sigma-70 family RNA polymerase sigma factor [Dehalococcoidia bacterium]MBK6562906.1 sigma-70 family RNA polymerase sigma factor [Dehalococcoidia bacterium]MBK7126549.1 sigma-70 family RNA polymerase sigma factor [Dehalococcoidia bacterium]MBK7329323.1 sigma-70 family RNA polymerase sigma factor [Dehalococcoidia bacterium]MBK8561749.1 sigma-70 family RNA polymerase sigma factor [Dehalococcoidia bacterium]
MGNTTVGELAPDFDEQAVVDAAQQGDHTALSALYDHYFPRVYRYVSVRLSSTEDAEDVTTEIFLRIIENLRSFSWRGLPFGAWVFRIARNEVVSHVRRQKVRTTTAQLTESIQDPTPDHVDTIVTAFTVATVREAAERLPEAQRQVIALRFGAGLSVAETAKALGKTENNVKVLQHKAIAKLQVMVRHE